MKKADREKKAKEIYDECKERGIKLELQGHWVMSDPKIPVSMIVDMAMCADELAALVRNSPSRQQDKGAK